MSLSENIVKARKVKGITQDELAQASNINVRTIQRIEAGETQPRAFTLKSISQVLDVSLLELTSQPVVASNLENFPTRSDKTSKNKEQITTLILSCFTFIVLPQIHFIVPIIILKKMKFVEGSSIPFAKRLIRIQVYWVILLDVMLILILGFNLLSTVMFNRFLIIHLGLIAALMYTINFIYLTITLIRMRK